MLRLSMASFYENTEILIHEDFTTKEDADYIISVVESQPLLKKKSDQSLSEEGDYSDFWDGKLVYIEQVPDLDQDVIRNMAVKAKLLYEDTYPELKGKINYSRIHAVHRFISGDFMPVHSDRGPHENNNDILHGFVIYLNDDYTGGELYYPRKGISIKPSKYSLIIHPGSEEYEHGVQKVVDGSRYAFTFFAHQKRSDSSPTA